MAGGGIQQREGRPDRSDEIVLFLFLEENIVVIFFAKRQRKAARKVGTGVVDKRNGKELKEKDSREKNPAFFNR